jgi:hypothetical protein
VLIRRKELTKRTESKSQLQYESVQEAEVGHGVFILSCCSQKTVVNPYKKKPKTFAVFNCNQQRTGMPDTKALTKKKAEVIVHHRSQTGCGKGKVASMHNTNTIWQLPHNKVLVNSNNAGNKWKLAEGIPTSTVGKYELKKVLIELHLMGFWWRLQNGTHHSCRDNKEGFNHTMDVLHRVFLEDDDGQGSIKKFAAKDITFGDIQDDNYNSRWDGIIELMVRKVTEKYKIGGQDLESSPVAATPFAIGARVATYQAAVKKATNKTDTIEIHVMHAHLLQTEETNGSLEPLDCTLFSIVKC